MMRVNMPLVLSICGCVLAALALVACGPPPCLNNQECPITRSCDVARKVCNSPDQPCREGAQRVCYAGAAGTRQLGTCRDGLETCNAGQWGACMGQILPAAEACDGQDRNCDGKVDQVGCAGCVDGEKRACYPGTTGCTRLADGSYDCKGICAAGQEVCAGGKWGACAGAIQPKSTAQGCDACANLDNDCDGQPDPGCICKAGETRACYSGPAGTEGKGVCKGGTQTCNNQCAWETACKGEVAPTTEICGDKIDNNCDGQIDENCNACELTGIFDTYLQDLFTGVPRTAVVITYTSAAGYFQGNLKLTSKSHMISTDSATFDKFRAEFIISGVESPAEIELTLTGDMFLAGRPSPCPFSYTFKKPICGDFQKCAPCSNDFACASVYTCQSGYCQNVKCSGNASVICEHVCVDVQTNAQHCGQCGNVCPAGQTCQGASCQ